VTRVELRCDVLVVGGGTAGFGAAVAAGRQGLDVVLMEAGPKVGGVMAFCPGMPWGGGYPCGEIVGGLIAELTDRLAALSPPAAEKRPCTLANFGPEIVYDPDMAQVVMFEMLEEARVRVHLNTTVTAPRMAGPRIDAVDFHDRHGPGVVRAGIVIDCSGDGDVSARAGVPFELGDASGKMMGVTLSFLLVAAPWDKVFAEGDPYFTRHAERGVAFLRDEVPGFEDAWMTQLGPTVGVRETRKLRGRYRLTGSDVAAARQFPDGIVACANPIDDVMRGDGEMTHDAAVADASYYTLPFGCLVPESVENLLFAGRNVSADPIAFASIRGMPQCMSMGQATGTAAAVALRAGIAVQAIDGCAIAAQMKSQGLWGLA
jgi:FAD dependent oxidoreductase/FAD binding domain